MKTLVVYDSFFGNTEQVARAIADGIGASGETRILPVKEAKSEDLDGTELLVVGSPTRGFRPSPDTLAFLDSLPAKGLQGKRVAAFDTRISLDKINPGLLRFFINTGGYAAKPIANRMIRKGGFLKAPPEGFRVLDKEGPLAEGELERAKQWGGNLRTL